jgi:hypothetical protein
VVVRLAVRDIPDDWEVVSRKIKRYWIATIFINIIFSWLLSDPEIFSTVTWTLRQKSTGVIKRVTANSESEAAERFAKGYFDSD